MPATTYSLADGFDLDQGSFDKLRVGFNIFALMLMQAAGLDDHHTVAPPIVRAASATERPAPIAYYNGFAQRLIEERRIRTTTVSGSTWVSAD